MLVTAYFMPRQNKMEVDVGLMQENIVGQLGPPCRNRIPFPNVAAAFLVLF
jgi:hypothetical protein